MLWLYIKYKQLDNRSAYLPSEWNEARIVFRPMVKSKTIGSLGSETVSDGAPERLERGGPC
jgi:hypothetical protein